jgi:CheY-like chemotaxis protein
MEFNTMSTESPRVLIVDDEAGLRRSLRFSLAQRGFVTEEVEEALPALQLIESRFNEGRPYNFVVADINLPDINGLKLLEVIKSKYPALPVIVISAYGSEGTQDAVSMKHGDAYLEKPFQVDDLAEVMHRIPSRRIEPTEAPAPALEKTSVSAYVMVKVRPDGDVMEVFRTLYYSDHVVYCDAVHDSYDIVLLVNGATRRDVDQFIETKVKTLRDIAEVEECSIVEPRIDPGIADFIKDYQNSVNRERYRVARSSTALSAYLLVEIQEGRFSEVFPKLYFLNGAVSCDATTGQYDAVVLLQSQTFKEIDRVLTEDVRLLDGIKRTRSVKIINMFEM